MDHQPGSRGIQVTDQHMRATTSGGVDRELIEQQPRANLIDVEEVQRRRGVRQVSLLNPQQPAQIRGTDAGQTTQLSAAPPGRKPPRDRDNFGVHRIMGTHRQQTISMAHTRRVQAPVQLRVTHDHRDTQAAAQLDMRIGPIRLNDHRRDVGLLQMAKELTTDIAQTAHHDMTAHQRNPHL